MRSALIGHSGFVGGNLLRQRPFDELFNSKNVEEIKGRSYELLVVSGAPAEKWRANKESEADQAAIDRLVAAISSVRAKKTVLISTVDVYPRPLGMDERTAIDTVDAQPYG